MLTLLKRTRTQLFDPSRRVRPTEKAPGLRFRAPVGDTQTSKASFLPFSATVITQITTFYRVPSLHPSLYRLQFLKELTVQGETIEPVMVTHCGNASWHLLAPYAVEAQCRLLLNSVSSPVQQLCYQWHSVDGEPTAERSHVICPKSHSW